MRITRKITGKRGGPGRGQGNIKLPMHKKRVQAQVYLPPEMREYVNAYKNVTGDSLSTTIVCLIDIARASLKNRYV